MLPTKPVNMKSPRPCVLFAPAPDQNTIRYQADGDGVIKDVLPQHFRNMMKMGCTIAET
jgi:hypothetical protein